VCTTSIHIYLLLAAYAAIASRAGHLPARALVAALAGHGRHQRSAYRRYSIHTASS